MTFQGDECAFLGQKDGDLERMPFQWDKCDRDMRAHYEKLGELRETLPALESPEWRAYAGTGPLLAFFRGAPGPGEVLAVFNDGKGKAELELPEGAWQDAVTGKVYREKLEVPGLGWLYLRLR